VWNHGANNLLLIFTSFVRVNAACYVAEEGRMYRGCVPGVIAVILHMFSHNLDYASRFSGHLYIWTLFHLTTVARHLSGHMTC
jgi:hypothetical protein